MQRKPASNGVQQSSSHHEADGEIKASLSELTAAVQAVQKASSWWDLYGVDWCYIASGFAMIPLGLLLLRYQTWPPFIAGLILLGFYYGMLKTKMSHLASHSALCHSKLANRFWQLFFIEFCGSFSSEYAISAHIKVHHPYTNVIGLGDSSTWKVPFLPGFIYLFVAPLFLPVMTPIAAVLFLLQDKKVLKAIQCFIMVSIGLVANISLLSYVSGLATKTAVLSTLVYRAVMEIPYIHVNIFQHIGLPMYARDSRPPRLHLMSNGVLNLSHNMLLDWNFGHSLIACHIEHHLFPKLSDNMCLKIQPIVQQYLQDHGLPYQKRGYINRLKFFAKEYKTLMVDAPPITQFIGVQ